MGSETESDFEQLGLGGYVEFEFDLPQALLSRLIEVFEAIEAAPLHQSRTVEIPDEQGVYQLFLDNQLVYVGKTDGDAGLKSRLSRHAGKLLQRKGLDPSRVTFKAVRIFVFTAMDLEGDLIKFYGGVKNLAWNGSGFGSNDPGKERDTTKVKDTNFDAQFPIDVDQQLDFQIEPDKSAAETIARLRTKLSFTLRFENRAGAGRQPHPDLIATVVSELKGPLTVRQALVHIAKHLPKGWQITALPGYVIAYKNDRRTFPSGSVVAMSP